MGLLTGVILYPSISETKRHKYIVWAVRVIALIMVILAFVLTIKNFCMFCTGDMIVVEAQQALTMRRYRRSGELACTRYGVAPLGHAVWRRSADIDRMLLARGVDTSHVSPRARTTAAPVL